MSNQHVILCGGLAAPAGAAKKATVPLQLWGRDPNVTLKITDISRKMLANIHPVLVDLLEIATYVYCADQATTRGGNTSKDYGSRWRRHFQFHIPVREPEVWSSDAVLTALGGTLGFLSDDEYEFTFEKLSAPPKVAEYLDFSAGEPAGFMPDEVVLFSGGLDSLGGAIQETLSGRTIALVSHRSSPKINRHQRELLEDLGRRCSRKPFHVPVWINKDKALGREFTQRTRSFLYASLAAVVARTFDLSRIRFYENGVVGINLPISAQVVGGRATRTTHPQVLNGFSTIFTALFQKPFIVENPFQWTTKAQVVRSIREAGFGDLIKHSVSCTHVWEMTRLHTHCGVCSQCIDRRFATLSAGCSDSEDPEEMYDVDLLKGDRKPGDDRTMLVSYVQTAKRVKDMSDAIFFSEFGEVHRVTKHIQSMSADDAASQILDLYKRHATEICDVITNGIREHAEDIHEGKLPSSSLLILALPEDYKRPTTAGNSVDLLQRIVRLLQEVIVERAQDIYESQLARLSQSNAQLGSDEHIALGNRLIILKDGKLFSADPKTRYPIGWEEIRDLLQEFNLWQTEVGADPDTDFDIINDKLLFLTDSIIGNVASFLKFLTLDDRTDTPEMQYGFSGVTAADGRIEANGAVPQGTRDKITKCNMLLYQLSRRAEKHRLQSQLGTSARPLKATDDPLGKRYQDLTAKLQKQKAETLDAILNHLESTSEGKGKVVPTEVPRNKFHKQGDYWNIEYEGERFQIKDQKGLGYIRHLLENPGREFHVLELVQAVDLHTADEAIEISVRPDDLLDGKAQANYRNRLLEIANERSEAQRNNDLATQQRLSREAEAIKQQVTGATGLGGRRRKFSNNTEKARVRICKNIKSACRKISQNSEKLGAQLRAIRTGERCIYAAVDVIPWEF